MGPDAGLGELGDQAVGKTLAVDVGAGHDTHTRPLEVADDVGQRDALPLAERRHPAAVTPALDRHRTLPGGRGGRVA